MSNNKGGRIKRGGYWYIKMHNHPNGGKQGYVAKHRLLMEQKIGRFLSKTEIVHHLNHDPSDNRLENLALCSSAGQHSKIFNPEALRNAVATSIGKAPWNKDRIEVACAHCGAAFVKTRNGKRKFCSKTCFAYSLIGRRLNIGTEFSKGQIPWNKGKKFSDETRERQRQSALIRWGKRKT